MVQHRDRLESSQFARCEAMTRKQTVHYPSTWETANNQSRSIELQKLSGTTYHQDIQGVQHEMSDEMRDKLKTLGTRPYGHVWRAKVGRTRRWHYGWEAEDALKRALEMGGLE